ncbi:RrF2 family transcriptional regulator [Demequina activiva]|uniref:HTH-type transcriptional regulator n=1 Tax=Demequina activiva TaxID=1582364 RepID=A0A919Q533_9MICO|nr:Rrf2 family transcriptional regulator [Demequina activiva]GIG54438.1 putative HTH-type transcriptional regulator [Demequina activiva]
MRISARAEYAVRAATELAAASPESATRTTEAIAQAQEIPRKFLEGILLSLREAQLVTAQRGIGGGYRLLRPADQITVADVVRAVDGPLVFVRGERPSDLRYDGSAEPLLGVWVALRARVREVLEGVTLADLARGDLPGPIAAINEDPAVWANPE